MTTLREAAQQALEALETAPLDHNSVKSRFFERRHHAITALRAALADGDNAAPTEPDLSRCPAEDDEGDQGMSGMNLRTAAQQALEAVEQTRRLMPDSYYYERLHKAAAALRAALAEPVQEPPCATRDCMPSECPNCASLEAQNTELDRKLAELERKPLTEEEMHKCCESMDAEPLAEGWPELIKFARAIERAHGIGEKE